MPLPWKLALDALIAGFRAFIGRLLFRKADADSGARDQRQDQDAADTQAADKAGATLDEWTKLTPEERRDRLDRFG